MTPICILVIAAVEVFWPLAGGRTRGSLIACRLLPDHRGVGNSLELVPLTMMQGSGRPDVVANIHLADLLYWALLAGCLFLFGLPGAALAWCLRTAADSLLLFWQSRIGLGSLAPMRMPFLLLLAALASLALQGPVRGAALAAVFFLACLWSIYHLPEELREVLGRFGRRCRGRRRRINGAMPSAKTQKTRRQSWSSSCRLQGKTGIATRASSRALLREA